MMAWLSRSYRDRTVGLIAMTHTEKNKFNKYRQKLALKSPWHLEEQVMSIQLYVGRMTCGYVVPLIFD